MEQPHVPIDVIIHDRQQREEQARRERDHQLPIHAPDPRGYEMPADGDESPHQERPAEDEAQNNGGVLEMDIDEITRQERP